MKSKSTTPGGHSGQSKTAEKDAGKPAKSQKSPAKRTPIKLRASTEKCIAKRTRDKSPKLSPASPSHGGSCKLSCTSHRGISSPQEQAIKSSAAGKSKKKKEANAVTVSKKTALRKQGITKAKAQRNEKGNKKKKVTKQSSPNSFIDLWTYASCGRREASLNATMKVNIIYERHSPSKSPKTPPKKIEIAGENSKQDENLKDKASCKGNTIEECSTIKQKKRKSGDTAQEFPTLSDKSCEKSPEQKKLSVKPDNKKPVLKSKLSDGSCRKRKSPEYKIFKEEPSTKIRKLEKKSPTKLTQKIVKRCRKNTPSGHQLSNIIEKCPRQASLVARAMIALDQEEDRVYDLAARTKMYDWMELRSLTHAGARKMHWYSGLGNSIKGKKLKNNEAVQSTKEDGVPSADADVGILNDPEAEPADSETLHNALLRTLHQIGDSRLLKEYLRAQKEDFQGQVDVERCTTPEVQSTPPIEKKSMSPPAAADKKPEKEIEKPTNCSPVKLQPCRVSSPNPGIPLSQINHNMTSNFIHHPIAQPIYPQQHAHPQQRAHTHPQTIKVTPYTPSPTYIYQYAMDRPQGGLYSPSSPSRVSYGAGNSEVPLRDYTSTFSLSHMDNLNLGRTGVHPFQPAPYNTSLHLPMQQIGFNYGAYYPSSIQTLPQQNMQTIPIHQQYPLVQNPVIAHQIPQDLGQIDTYQHEYPAYPSLPHVGQDAACMPPPPPPPAHRPATPSPLRHRIMAHHSLPAVSPMDSLRSMNPVGVQPIVRSPALDFSTNFVHHQSIPHEQLPSFPSCRPNLQLNSDHPSNSSFKYSVTGNGQNKCFSPCKKEHDEVSSYDCDFSNKNSMYKNENISRSLGSKTDSEGSDVSDLLHSAHTTMYQIDGMNSLENIREFHQAQASVSNSTLGNYSPSKMSIPGHTSFSASYSVSSILDMPVCKVKSEPEQKICAVSHSSNILNSVDQKIVELPQSAVVCFASTGVGTGFDCKYPDSTPPDNKHQKCDNPRQSSSSSSNQAVKNDKFEKSTAKGVIIIEDTDGSSDDEPLARLVTTKLIDNAESHALGTHSVDSLKLVNVLNKSKLSTPHIPVQQPKIKTKQKEKVTEQTKPTELTKLKKPTSAKLQCTGSAKHVTLKPQDNNTSASSENCMKPQTSVADNESTLQADKETNSKSASKKATLGSSSKAKKSAKKMKDEQVGLLTPPKVNTNHGWSWVGEGQMRPVPKIQGKEEPVRIRKCYQSMRHTSGETVSVRDSVILQSDGDGSIPFVAKVSALWENLNGEMMFSMLWYYQPEHTAAGREPDDGDQEVFASKHREENSVACIDDKCFVLMYNEYCRLEAESARREQGVPVPKWRELMPEVPDDDKKLCRPLPPAHTCADNIWFCRYDYDVRKKVVKKPKLKKSNLRYRAPFKVV